MNDIQKLYRLRRLTQLLDSEFRGPFGWRFGLDGLLGLIPVVGDFFTSAASLYIIGQSALMGTPPAILLRMFFWRILWILFPASEIFSIFFGKRIKKIFGYSSPI